MISQASSKTQEKNNFNFFMIEKKIIEITFLRYYFNITLLDISPIIFFKIPLS